MPHIEKPNAHHKYEVLKPIENLIISEIAPAFDQVGGGIQYLLPDTVDELLDAGVLRSFLYNSNIGNPMKGG